MVESGSHYIDLLRYLFGEINSVASVTSNGLSRKTISDCDIYNNMLI
jgi:predicted dehydrogenase